MKKTKMMIPLLLVLALVTVLVPVALTARAADEVEVNKADTLLSTVSSATADTTIKLTGNVVLLSDSSTLSNSSGATITIDLNGHKLQGANLAVSFKGTFVVTDGAHDGNLVTAKVDSGSLTLKNVKAGQVTLKDGSTTMIENAEVDYITGDEIENVSLSVKSGTIKELGISTYQSGNSFKLSGGTYESICCMWHDEGGSNVSSVNLGDLLAEGYTYSPAVDLNAYEAENVSVVEKPNVARIGENSYKSLKEALDAAQGKDTVEVIENVTILESENLTVPSNVRLQICENMTLTVDGTLTIVGGACISNSGTIVNNGTLTIKGTGVCDSNATHLPKTDACVCQICGGTAHRQESDSYTSTATGHKAHYPCCDTEGEEEAHRFNETSGLCDVCDYNMAVAQVGNTFYQTLDEALTKWTNGTKLTLLKNVESTGEIEIKNKTVTLDLNGYTMSNSYCIFTVAEGAGLTVEDSSESGTGVIKYTNTNDYAVFSKGALTIEGGTITSGAEHNEPVFIRAGTLKMTGGKIENTANKGALNIEPEATKAEITGGTINGYLNSSCPDLTISNATVSGPLHSRGATTIGSDVTLKGDPEICWYKGDLDLSEADCINWKIETVERYFEPGTLTLPERCELRVDGEKVDELDYGQTATISKKTVTVTVDDLTIPYGETYVESNYTTNGLVSDDVLSVDPDGFIASTTNVTDCGTVSIDKSKIQVVGDGGTDVTEYYEFVVVPGTLTIEPDLTELKALDLDAVKSDNRETIEEVQTLLKAGKFTNKEWLDALEKCEDLLDKLDAADAAASTENIQQAENVTESNVKFTDLTVLEKAKADLNKALEENAGNYTDEETEAIREELERIDELLDAIYDVQILIDAIAKVTDPVSPDDLDGAAHILDLLDDYNEMSAAQKAMVHSGTKEKLDGLVKGLTDYKIIKGNESTWTREAGGSLTITANGALSKFTGLLVDGKAVDKANYEAKSGSTIITLKESYVKSLTDGEHTFTFLYTDGRTDGSFAIIPLSANDTGNGTNNGTNNGTGTGNGTNNSTTSNTPATGDTSHVTVWIVLLALSACAGTAVVIGKRKAK